MSLLFFDGFETYGLGEDLLTDIDVYDFAQEGTGTLMTIETSDRITDGQLIQLNMSPTPSPVDLATAYGPQLPLARLSSQDDWVFGIALRIPGGGLSATQYIPVFELNDSDNKHMISLRLRGNGDLRLDLLNIPFGTVNVATAVGAVTDVTVWNYLEFKVKLHGSAGSYDVRLNEASVMSGSGAKTSNSGATRPSQLRLGHSSSGPTWWDDLYILDDQGSVNNDFLGDVFVQGPRPNGVGDSSQFDPSAAVDNFTLVNEDAADGDASYVESNTATERDLYQYEDLVDASGATIFGVIAKPVLRKSDGGSRTYKLLAKHGVAEDESPTRHPATDYVRQAYVFETNPTTGSLWTETEYNAAQFGLEIVA